MMTKDIPDRITLRGKNGLFTVDSGIFSLVCAVMHVSRTMRQSTNTTSQIASGAVHDAAILMEKVSEM